MDKRYLDRIPPISNFEESVCKNISKSYKFGDFKSYYVVETGYEDFNFILTTGKGKYFVKLFDKKRKKSECKRIVDLIIKLIKEGVHHPKVYSNNSNSYLHKIEVESNEILLCVMDFIDGKNFFELNELPNYKEIKQLAIDLSHINSIKLKKKIPLIYDSWAIINFSKEYNKKKQYLNSEEIKILEPIIEEFKSLDIEYLPKALVHGDILKTNTIKDKQDKVWIIDFSVANLYPRILEIAIIATHLLFDASSKEKTINNLRILLEEYEKHIKLSPEEKEALPKFIRFSYGIEFLNTVFEKRVNKNNSQENESLYQEAKKGLEWENLYPTPR